MGHLEGSFDLVLDYGQYVGYLEGYYVRHSFSCNLYRII